MEKLRVLMVHNYYQIPGGENVVFEAESIMLKENGHEVYQYVRHNNELKNIGPFSKILLFFKTIFSFKTYREVKKIIKEKKIDIVHIHNSLPLISPSVYYAAFSSKAPVVQTVHNYRLLCPGATFYRNNQICEQCANKGLKHALKYKCYRNSLPQSLAVVCMLKLHRLAGTYKRINGYIFLTESNIEKFSILKIPKNRIYVKPNFTIARASDNQSSNEGEYFVFIGRLDRGKGIYFLVESWQYIKSNTLIIIGTGPEYDNIDQYLKNNKIGNVKLLGYMEHNKAVEVINKSIAVIVPSQCYEAFGLVTIEAFSEGKPVIAANIGALNYIVNENNGIRFKYNDTSEFLNAVKVLLSDKERYRRLSNGAFKSYKEEYTKEINYIKLLDIYNDIILKARGEQK